MHALGVLHRDISMGNILIDAHTCDVKICDFGVVRQHAESYSAVNANT